MWASGRTDLGTDIVPASTTEGNYFYNESTRGRKRVGVRQRYYVLASVMYMALGGVILVRSLLAHVIPVGLLGAVFIALGAVRLRDYFARGRDRS
jgi:uncharacterized membrane protein HdeD (DUF308 family)